MDQIHINELELFAYHGVNPEEREHGQIFLLDISAGLSLKEAGESDLLLDTVSYAQMIKTVRAVFCSESYALLEKAATRVCAALFAQYPQIRELTVTLKKPDAPIQAKFGSVGITITRKRG